VPVETAEAVLAIVPLLEPAVLPVTSPIPTTPLMIAAPLTNTLKPEVRRTFPKGTVSVL
jgi:hypothetical protein